MAFLIEGNNLDDGCNGYDCVNLLDNENSDYDYLLFKILIKVIVAMLVNDLVLVWLVIKVVIVVIWVVKIYELENLLEHEEPINSCSRVMFYLVDTLVDYLAIKVISFDISITIIVVLVEVEDWEGLDFN